MLRIYRFRKPLAGCVLGVFIGTTLFLQQWRYLDGGPPDHIALHPFFNASLDDIYPASLEDQSCRFTKIHPLHPSTWKYFPPAKPIRCKVRQPDLVYLDRDGYLRLNTSEVIKWGLGPTQSPSVKCSFKPILRPPGDDMAYYYGQEKLLTVSGVRVDYDCVLVTCTAPNFLGILESEVYSAFHVHARHLPPSSSSPTTSSKPISVVILGVDSMSRLAFMRFLPSTYRYLTQVMGGIVFTGMNKVADNTFPNLAAILTGERVYGGRMLHPPNIPHYDSWPIIWKNYSKAGYVTHFAEDYPDYNMFTYLSTGFKDPPTDYYFRPFWLAAQDSAQFRHSSHLCLGPKQMHVYQLDYLISFLRRYRHVQSRFAFSFLAEFTHDYLSRTSAADQSFADTLATMHREGLVNDTIFVFLSDHGHRFDHFRLTPLGRLEERTPFFSMVLPPSLSHYKDILVENSARLTSPYDLHATLSDLLDHVTNGSELGHKVTQFGRTVFGSIPLNRTCNDTGIPDYYCACGLDIDEMSLDDDLQLAQGAGQALIDQVNGLLNKLKLCYGLVLQEVKSVQRLKTEQSSNNQTLVPELFTVLVQAGPSGALLEGNVRLWNGTFRVEGDVSRINKYKGQSDCIKDPVLRKYCYCKK